MSTFEKVNELASKRQKSHTNAHIRIEELLDANSFVEVGSFNDDAGVVTGYGTIDSRLVYVYSQNSAVNVKHANKIGRIYEHALKMGAPVIGIMDSKGLTLEDGIDTFEAYGILFLNQTSASGIVPQICVIVGDCIGVSTFTPVLSDFVFMTEQNSKFFMISPSTFSGLDGKSTTYEDIGGSENHSGKTGLIHCSYKTEELCLRGVRQLVSLLPANNLEEAISLSNTDDLNRIDLSLDTIIPDDTKAEFNIKEVILSVADNNYFFEIQENFAKNIIVGLARINGCTVGIVANKGLMNIACAQKAGEFIKICDAFNIPIISFTDILGYETTFEEETNGIMKYSAKLMYSFASATVPKINILIRNGIGNAYLVMNSKHIGADVVYAWPTANISLINKEGYVNIINISENEYERISNPYAIAAKGYIDDIIIPSNTRKRIIVALEMLSTKRELKPARKHSSVEF